MKSVALPVQTAPGTKRIPCPQCQSQEFHLYFETSEIQTVRCLNCQLVFNNPPRLSADKIAAIYSERYYRSTQPNFGYEDYIGNRIDIQKSFERKIKILLRHIQKGKLLDVGCACGFFLGVASHQGFDVSGIDCSVYATDYARSEFPKFRIETGMLEDTKIFHADEFDIITFWDVIEQLPDPRPIFKAMNRLLKLGGYLCLTIRDIDSWMARILKEKWIHFRPDEKFVYFNRKNISNFLNSHGFQIKEITRRHSGKDCTVDVLLHKLANIHGGFAALTQRIFERLGWTKKRLYLNFMDGYIIIAQKTKTL